MAVPGAAPALAAKESQTQNVHGWSTAEVKDESKERKTKKQTDRRTDRRTDRQTGTKKTDATKQRIAREQEKCKTNHAATSRTRGTYTERTTGTQAGGKLPLKELEITVT